MVYILKLNRCVYLRTKFDVFSIILTSFRRGNLVEKRTPKKKLARLGFKALKVNDADLVSNIYFSNIKTLISN